MIPYLAILTTALAAFCGAPVYAIIPGAAVLLAISLREQRKFAARFAAIGSSDVLQMAAYREGDAGITAVDLRTLTRP